MDESELATYQKHTAREKPPSKPVREAWQVIGRRGGKTRNAALAALFLAIRFDVSQLAPGEMGVVGLFASDRKQARQLLNYLRGFCEADEFRPFVHRFLKESLELNCGVNLEVTTASVGAPRGYTLIGAILDEVAFWPVDEFSACPDSAVVSALRPGMSSIDDSLLLALSSPYACRGELWVTYQRYFGKDVAHTLVWNADTRSMNSSISADVVARAFEQDAVAAASEFGRDSRVQFRRDVQSFLDVEAIAAVTVSGRRELPPVRGVKYVAFADPSGGSVDSFTLAIAHLENDLTVLDCVRERRARFSPDSVVEQFSALLNTYGCREVIGDRYGGAWVVEQFERRGIRYRPSPLAKSDIYSEFLPSVNASRVALLDLGRLKAQLLGLERRTARGGRDSIDHAPGAKDDLANCVAGALVLALPSPRKNNRRKVMWV